MPALARACAASTWDMSSVIEAWLTSTRVMYLILELAVRSGRIARNPAHGVRLRKMPKSDKRFLTRDEVFRLADAAAEYPIPEIASHLPCRCHDHGRTRGIGRGVLYAVAAASSVSVRP